MYANRLVIYIGYRPRPVYASGYPVRGAYPQYGVYSQFGGFPGVSRYPTSFRPYSGVASYPYSTLGAYYPVSHGNRQYRPQGYLMAREQLANLYGGSVGPKPLPFRTTMGGPVSDYETAPADYYEDVKPEDQPTPLAAYYAYYRQLFESEAENPESRYGQLARINPEDFAVQQPRPYANYQIPRYFK